MLALLPLSALLLVILLIHQVFPRQLSIAPWRFAILGGATCFGAAIVLITEGLSLFHALTKGTVTLSWAILCIALGVVLVRKQKKNRSQIGATFQKESPKDNVTPLSLIERISLVGMAIIASLTLVIVLVAAPNNWDSLTYHLPRVMHWIQNQTVAFFVTPDARQICFPPWSEYHILQYQILLGNDRLAALPQWLSFIGASIAASLAAKLLGAKRSGQILASVLMTCLPMAILQATSTQNDLTGGFWLLTTVCFGLTMTQCPSLILTIGFGLATGLALFSKTTIYIYAFPFIVSLAVWMIFKYRHKALMPLVTAGVLAFLLNTALYQRNMDFCRDPLGDGPHIGISVKNQHFSLKPLLSNVLRNAGLHLLTPSGRINDTTERGIRYLHKVIGADINDPATTFLGNRYETKWLSTFEDDAANPIHFVLAIMLVPLACILMRRNEAKWSYWVCFLCIISGAMLFCLLLQWQPWHSRQHTPLFLCVIPLIAAAVSKLPWAKFWTNALTILLLITSIPYVLGNETRPLLFPMTPDRFHVRSVLTTPRMFQFPGRDIPQPWAQAFDQIRRHHYSRVGLQVHWFSCEYPIWLLAANVPAPLRIEHVCVTNMPTTAQLRNQMEEFLPDAILRFSDGGSLTLRPGPESMICNGIRYSLSWQACDPQITNMCARLYTPVQR